MKRIVVVGCYGSGKSTLARRLGAVLGLQVIHLDALYWKANSVLPSDAEWWAIVQSVVAQEEWILDGQDSRTQDLRFKAADTIIFLDFPRWLCYSRTIKRQLQFWRGRKPQVEDGSLDKLNWNLLKWIWRYPSARRLKVITDTERYAQGRSIVILRRPEEVQRFLSQLQ